MKRIVTLTLALVFAACGLMAQNHGHHNCGNCPNHGKHKQHQQAQQPRVNADGIDMVVVAAFPTVKSLKKEQKWSKVLDKNGKLLGYVVYSKPASNGIKGYNGETPVMIALNAKKKIAGVYPLPNNETPKYAKRVADTGLYNSWNGLSIKKARKKKVDAVTGCTYTSRAVIQSVQAALETL